MMLMRKVAQASTGEWKDGSFDQWWPLSTQDQKETPSWAATSIEFRNKIREQLKNRK